MDGADTHEEYIDFEEKNVSLVLLSAIKQWYIYIWLFSGRREPLFMVYLYIKNKAHKANDASFC